MIDDIENKIEFLNSGKLLKKYVLLEVSYLARNIYEMETVTSELRYIEDLIFLETNIVWMCSQLIVQWNYVKYFHIRSLTAFFNSFLHQFLENSA